MQNPVQGHRPRPQWIALALLILAAGALRVLFVNGTLGSDDVVYLARAIDVAEGHWTSANYNGALRYGFNLPAGAMLAAFGTSEISANLWPLFCSLLEIAAVYVFTLHAAGRQAAWLAALALAVTPLHIASAMRIHADPVVAVFLTLAFVFLYFGERYGRAVFYLFSGLSIGMVFWVKELVIVTLLALLLYPLVWRRISMRWAFFVLGGLIMLAGHLALMTVIAGDPLHLIKVVSGQVSRNFIGNMEGEDSAFYYFRFLFLDVRHTWLLAPLAVLAIVLWRRNPGMSQDRQTPDGIGFAVFWMVGLICVLSFLPVSFSPLRLPMKQSNYLTLFLAPMAVLAGVALATLGGIAAKASLLVMVAGGILLGALQQQAYRVFSSNSKALVSLMQDQPDSHVFGSTNNGNMIEIQSMLGGTTDLKDRFTYLSELPDGGVAQALEDLPKDAQALVVIDRETLSWGGKPPRLTKALPCWNQLAVLEPQGFGYGRRVLEVIDQAAAALPGPVANRIHGLAGSLLKPRAATVYAVDRADPQCLHSAGDAGTSR